MRPASRSFRTLLFTLIDLSGAPSLFLSDEPRILLYHGVTNEAGEGIFNYRSKFVPTAAFADQIFWLNKTFTILPLGEFVKKRAEGTLPPRALAITFDDGYANNYEYAYPVLRDRGVPATFFLTTDFIERGDPLPVDRIEYAISMTALKELHIDVAGTSMILPLATRNERINADLFLRSRMKKMSGAEADAFIVRLEEACGRKLEEVLSESPYRPLTWEMVRKMQTNGMSFAPHTCAHPILSRLSTEAARQEIESSKKLLAERIGDQLPIFAYPNGQAADYGSDTMRTLQELGFTAALTTRPEVIRPTDSALQLPRFTLDGATDLHRARLMVSGVYVHLTHLF